MTNIIRPIRIAAATLLAAATFVVIAGCDAGDTNPVTPEKMEEIRNKTNRERENFRPPTDTPAKPTN